MLAETEQQNQLIKLIDSTLRYESQTYDITMIISFFEPTAIILIHRSASIISECSSITVKRVYIATVIHLGRWTEIVIVCLPV